PAEPPTTSTSAGHRAASSWGPGWQRISATAVRICENDCDAFFGLGLPALDVVRQLEVLQEHLKNGRSVDEFVLPLAALVLLDLFDRAANAVWQLIGWKQFAALGEVLHIEDGQLPEKLNGPIAHVLVALATVCLNKGQAASHQRVFHDPEREGFWIGAFVAGGARGLCVVPLLPSYEAVNELALFGL